MCNHIIQSKKYLTKSEKTRIDILCIDEPLNQLIRQRLSCLIVFGDHLQPLFGVTPILQHLRRSFNKVTLHGSASKSGESCRCQHVMKDMSKFMEIGYHFIMLQ